MVGVAVWVGVRVMVGVVVAVDVDVRVEVAVRVGAAVQVAVGEGVGGRLGIKVEVDSIDSALLQPVVEIHIQASKKTLPKKTFKER